MNKSFFVVPAALISDSEEVTKEFAEQLAYAITKEISGMTFRPRTQMEFSCVLRIDEAQNESVPFTLDVGLSLLATGFIMSDSVRFSQLRKGDA